MCHMISPHLHNLILPCLAIFLCWAFPLKFKYLPATKLHHTKQVKCWPSDENLIFLQESRLDWPAIKNLASQFDYDYGQLTSHPQILNIAYLYWIGWLKTVFQVFPGWHLVKYRREAHEKRICIHYSPATPGYVTINKKCVPFPT